MNSVIAVIVFLFGACIGSFLNVCIYRLPLKKSVIWPSSSCTSCGNLIRFYDNIPIISYIVLRGRCRYCGAGYSARYPAIEFLSGVLALVTWMYFGLTFHAAVYFIYISSLIVITFIDIQYRIIPNSITLPGIPIAMLAASFLIPEMTFLQSVAGVLAGGGVLYLIAAVYVRIARIEGMGLGDVKLLAMIGALTGIKGVIVTVLLSSISGTTAGLAAMMYNKKWDSKLSIPYGPFLSAGSIIHIFFGDQLIDLYFSLMS